MKTETSQPKPSELANHTPGKWIANHKSYEIYSEGGDIIAQLFDNSGEEHAEANLELIASAPALLKQRDALKVALAICETELAMLEEMFPKVGPPRKAALEVARQALALCDKVEDAPQVISTHIRWNEKGEAEVIETTMDKDGKIHPAVKQ